MEHSKVSTQPNTVFHTHKLLKLDWGSQELIVFVSFKFFQEMAMYIVLSW